MAATPVFIANLLAQLNPDQTARLISAQKLWILFKEREILLIEATYGKVAINLWRIAKANAVM